ncbi:unnamed protein product [Discula destructiva]
MGRARFPQRLSSLHIVIGISILLLFIISGSYHEEVKTYLVNTPATSDSTIINHNTPDPEFTPSQDKPSTSGSQESKAPGLPSLMNEDLSDHGISGGPGSASGHVNTPRIPNIVHFTQISSNPDAPFSFDFRQCLSIYSAWLHMRPDTIFIHTNATDAQIDSARRGLVNKWAKVVLGLPNVVVNQVEMPTHAGNGVHIDWLAHTSDFLRVEMAKKYGGTYLDTDVYTLKDLKPLRESNFGMIGARTEAFDNMNSGQWMTEPQGRVISAWADEMHKVFVGSPYNVDGWARGSDEAFRKVGQKLFGEPGGHMLILEERAFTPGRVGHAGDAMLTAIPGFYAWTPEHANPLFTNDLTNFAMGDPLPDFEKVEADGNIPPWAEDWSTAYLFHAFMPHEMPMKEEYIAEWTGHKYKRVTPRYVLERQTKFARALYPVAKHMYEAGHLHIDDTDKGV